MTLLLQYTLIFASVLLLVALGGCFAERSGVINIGLEGALAVNGIIQKLQFKTTGIVHDRRKVVKDFSDTPLNKGVVTCFLHLNKIGQIDDVFGFGKSFSF